MIFKGSIGTRSLTLSLFFIFITIIIGPCIFLILSKTFSSPDSFLVRKTLKFVDLAIFAILIDFVDVGCPPVDS